MLLVDFCCCLSSIRRGCYVCLIYSVIFYTLTLIFHLLSPTPWDFSVSSSCRNASSIPEDTTEQDPQFVTSFLGCTALRETVEMVHGIGAPVGLLCCLLLWIGLHWDFRFLLLPWIVILSAITLLDIANDILQLTGFHLTTIVAFILTFGFLIRILNICAVLCVAAQFQELSLGRGRARKTTVSKTGEPIKFTLQTASPTSRGGAVESAQVGFLMSDLRPITPTGSTGFTCGSHTCGTLVSMNPRGEDNATSEDVDTAHSLVVSRRTSSDGGSGQNLLSPVMFSPSVTSSGSRFKPNR